MNMNKDYSKRQEKNKLLTWIKMPNFGEALYDLPFDLKSNFRKLENSYKKHIMSK